NTLDVATVVGSPNVDHVGEAAVDLAFVVSNVGGEVGIAAVRLPQWPVDVVAEFGRTEQCLFSILPILDRCALGGGQPPFVDQTGAAQRLDGLADLVAVAPVNHRPL